MRYLYQVFISFFLIFYLSMNTIHADLENIAKVVKYPITLNGILINNLNSEFPLINYKDITYFPLSWNLSHFMGLETEWDPNSGLTINKVQSFTEYNPEDTTFNNYGEIYPISIPTYNITINNEKISNSHEQYPLINFRGITYFPLNSHFVVDTFGWEYSWSKTDGLKINSREYIADAEKESVISLVNLLTFGPDFEFEASYTNKSSGETKNNIIGNRINETHDSKFITKAIFSEPLEYKSSVKIIGYNKTFNDFNPQKESMGTGVDFSDTPFEVIRTVGPGSTEIDEAKLMIALLELHFVGDERNQIQSIELVQKTEEISTWKINTRNKQIKLDVQDMKIINIQIQEEKFTFWYSIN